MIYLVFAGYLLLTVIIEGVAVALLFRQMQYVYYSLLCNLLTNPALNLLLLLFVKQFGENMYIPVLLLAEVAVVFVEAAVYKYICGFRMSKALLLSAFLNVLSFAAGLALNFFIV